MRKELHLLTWALIGFGLVACSSPREDLNLKGVNTDFIPEAVLSSKEQRDVVKLAHQCGMDAVAKIHTYIQPTAMCRIGVKSVEESHGREVVYTQLFINSRRWMKAPGEAGTTMPITKLGRLWVSEDLQQVRLTKFNIRGTEVRVALRNKISISLADRIIAAFAEGRVRYKNDALKSKVAEIDFLMPESLSHDKGAKYSVFFTGDYIVHFTFDNGSVMVLAVDQILV